MKQQEDKHPAFNTIYHSLYFNITEPAIGQVRILFEDHASGYTYHTTKSLQQISYKTVITGLNQSQPQIIKAALFPYGDTYRLLIRVKLQYLNQIEQIFDFNKQQMRQQRRKQIKAKSQARKGIDKLKQQLLQSQKEYIISGTLNNRQRMKHQIKLDVREDTTIFHLTLSFNKMHSQVIKVGYYYYDTLTNSKVSDNMIPDQLYSHGITEISLVAEKSKFDKVVLTLEGDFEAASYTIKSEGAIESKPMNVVQMLFRIAAVGFCIWLFYTYDYYLGSSNTSEV